MRARGGKLSVRSSGSSCMAAMGGDMSMSCCPTTIGVMMGGDSLEALSSAALASTSSGELSRSSDDRVLIVLCRSELGCCCCCKLGIDADASIELLLVSNVEATDPPTEGNDERAPKSSCIDVLWICGPAVRVKCVNERERERERGRAEWRIVSGVGL